MNRMLVMTVIGNDRPGLVESVAGVIAQHGGNWLESRMSRLGGQFAGILRVSVPAEQEAAVVRGLSELGRGGLAVVVHPDAAETTKQAQRLSMLEIVGQDRPGIVRQITHSLAKYGVNVEELQSECASAAMTGETLFKASAKLSIPNSCNTEELRRELEKIAADLIVEISFVNLHEGQEIPGQPTGKQAR
jgi:glycine cleavage system regulatory protein